LISAALNDNNKKLTIQYSKKQNHMKHYLLWTHFSLVSRRLVKTFLQCTHL